MYDLVVVGAGPYGLSIASHAAASGLNVRVFGRTMASWRDHMPRGMFLKSEPWASHLSDPESRFGLDTYCAGIGVAARHAEPIPVETFARYGMWFADRAVPGVDQRMVTGVGTGPGGYRAVTEDGEIVHARTVALAIGVLPFTEIPAALRHLGPELVSHSSHHEELLRFHGRDVTVVGAGQAALETAALLAEQGTRVRVLARSDRLNWNTVPLPWQRPWWQSARTPHSGLGPGWRNWGYSELPWAFRRLPEATRTRIASSALGPAGAWWLRDRVEPKVEVRLTHHITGATPTNNGVRLEVTGPSGPLAPFETDHVIAATGFRPTCDRIALLSDELRDGLASCADGSPEVSTDFESTWPGLFLAGLVTASSFGPSMRFVHGATYTAPRLVKGVNHHLRHPAPKLPSPTSPPPTKRTLSRA
ncbi:NAD(P)-binding domain-containing protein [Streptomyces sp. NPDC091292]|uniref:NAD(P)-binding domain-containing protein n=1 Tax=Streptomyces sp. NPDC091292 TaxID=3365991 RepID=UPI0038292FCC